MHVGEDNLLSIGAAAAMSPAALLALLLAPLLLALPLARPAVLALALRLEHFSHRRPVLRLVKAQHAIATTRRRPAARRPRGGGLTGRSSLGAAGLLGAPGAVSTAADGGCRRWRSVARA